VTEQELESRLWETANTLRGSPVDRTDWKGYILPLRFFKRISDVWDEETAEAAQTYGDAEPSLFPEVHRFQVPGGCHWRDIRETLANVGTALAHARNHKHRQRFIPIAVNRPYPGPPRGDASYINKGGGTHTFNHCAPMTAQSREKPQPRQMMRAIIPV